MTQKGNSPLPDSESLLRVDIVVPVYNEEEAVAQFHASLVNVVASLPYNFHFLYINDGSSDRTQEILESLAETDPRITIVELSRNFGHQAALSAGLDLANGDVVITMDGDGQHPPGLIPQMLSTYQSGYDVVLMQRTGHETVSAFKRWSASFFYWTIRHLSNLPVLPGVADFRLLSHNVVQALRTMPEHHRFLRGMIAWAGFRTAVIPYALGERLGGQPKYTLKKMVRLALDAIFSFSFTPLWLNLWTGIILLLLAIPQAICVLTGLSAKLQAQGILNLGVVILAVLLVGSTLMFGLSLIGIYVGYIFQEVKRRPVYLVRSIHSKSSLSQENSYVDH